MVEGRSGLLAAARARERAAMRFEPSRKRLVFASGAEAFLYSGASPDGLRGPQHHAAWCDELAKWPKAAETWANLRLGLRLGARPRALVTTTPRGVKALTAILAAPGTKETGGATWANPHLPDAAVAEFVAEHRGTRFGRQELEGVLIADVEGALWTRDTIEKARERAPVPAEWMKRIVVGVDPPASAEGRCGIVVCGLGADDVAYVLADMSLSGASPDGWARRVCAAAAEWSADRVVAEKNQGGAMVESVLRGAGAGLPVTLVHAAEGKSARAEPVALRFEKGEAKFAGAFPELEDELAGLVYGGGYEGPGRSPDRADAMVWAMTELLVRARRAEPRVRRL
ncbi:MAG TPA: terminase family protein [Allosphingosinicella sp.]|jgi:phage terminase large subunit-like protein